MEYSAVSGTYGSMGPSSICTFFQFIVLATDGLWDVFSSQEVVTFIHEVGVETAERVGGREGRTGWVCVGEEQRLGGRVCECVCVYMCVRGERERKKK